MSAEPLPAAAACPFAQQAQRGPWLDRAALRDYLKLKNLDAASEWVRRHKVPRAEGTKFLVRIENVDRVLSGYPPLPLSAFLKNR